MLLKADQYAEYGLNPEDATVPRKLEAIEHRIRAYTNNPFHVRAARFEAASADGILLGSSPHIKAGDTVHVTVSDLNEGIYTVTAVEDGRTVLSESLYDDARNRATLVRYPADVIDGAVGILKFDEARPAGKAGIASEALSRHSVSYDTSGNEGGGAFAGYPKRLTAFLKPYRKARF